MSGVKLCFLIILPCIYYFNRPVDSEKYLIDPNVKVLYTSAYRSYMFSMKYHDIIRCFSACNRYSLCKTVQIYMKDQMYRCDLYYRYQRISGQTIESIGYSVNTKILGVSLVYLIL